MDGFLSVRKVRRFRSTSAILLITGLGSVIGLYGVLLHAVGQQHQSIQTIQKNLIQQEIVQLQSDAELALSRFAYRLHQYAGRPSGIDLTEFYNWSVGRTDGFILFDREGRQIAGAGIKVSADSFRYCLAATAPHAGLHRCPVSGNSVIYVVVNDPFHPSRFRLVFYRDLETKLAARISRLTGLPLRFVPLNEAAPTIPGYRARSLILTNFRNKPLLQMVSYYPQVHAHIARNFLLATGLTVLLIAVLIFGSTSMRQLSAMASQLKSQNESLDRQARQRTSLLRTLSHDLNNYLASAQGYLELALMHRQIPAKVRNYLMQVQRAIRVEAEVIRMVRQQLSVEQNRPVLQSQPVCLAHLLDQSLANFNLRLEKKQLRILRDDHLRELVVQVDPIVFVVNVLNNLISNAIKFSPPGGIIRIASRADQTGGVEFSICDAGQGMSPEQIQHILNGEPLRSRPGTVGESGSGLGMAQVLEAIEPFGGQLHIESSTGPDAGTCFRLRLPLSQASCFHCREEEARLAVKAPPHPLTLNN